MLEFAFFMIAYCIYLIVENIYNGFIIRETIQYMHDRNIELQIVLADVPDTHYYFQKNKTIELREPIRIPFNDYNKI